MPAEPAADCPCTYCIESIRHARLLPIGPAPCGAGPWALLTRGIVPYIEAPDGLAAERLRNGHGWICEVDERTVPPASEKLAKPLNQPYKGRRGYTIDNHSLTPYALRLPLTAHPGAS